MAIKRACSWSVEISTPDPLSEYDDVLVTFSQNQEIVVEKHLADLEASSDGAIVNLSQEETKLFSPSEKSPMGAAQSGPAYMQIRTYKSSGEAPGSECWRIPVLDSLNDTVIGNE